LMRCQLGQAKNDSNKFLSGLEEALNVTVVLNSLKFILY